MPHRTKKLRRLAGTSLVIVCFATTLVATRAPAAQAPDAAANRAIRQALWDELQPVTLENCTLRRFGGPNDGGYLICENLIQAAQSAYSYGIAGEDNWGCDLSRRTGVAIHQYDCFDLKQPVCDGGRVVFHPECIGTAAATIDNRPFDTLENQIARNGDAGKRLIVKIDVEGAEWDSLLATPDSVLERIEQMPMEMHALGELGLNEARFVETVRKLKRTFHLVHRHFNNFVCDSASEPMLGRAFQLLWVNKRIGILDAKAPPPVLPHPEDRKDDPDAPDCQVPVVTKPG